MTTPGQRGRQGRPGPLAARSRCAAGGSPPAAGRAAGERAARSARARQRQRRRQHTSPISERSTWGSTPAHTCRVPRRAAIPRRCAAAPTFWGGAGERGVAGRGSGWVGTREREQRQGMEVPLASSSRLYQRLWSQAQGYGRSANPPEAAAKPLGCGSAALAGWAVDAAAAAHLEHAQLLAQPCRSCTQGQGEAQCPSRRAICSAARGAKLHALPAASCMLC